jgi:hypothetical protein
MVCPIMSGAGTQVGMVRMAGNRSQRARGAAEETGKKCRLPRFLELRRRWSRRRLPQQQEADESISSNFRFFVVCSVYLLRRTFEFSSCCLLRSCLHPWILSDTEWGLTEQIELTTLVCVQCGRSWHPCRPQKPKRCPNPTCRSVCWDATKYTSSTERSSESRKNARRDFQ